MVLREIVHHRGGSIRATLLFVLISGAISSAFLTSCEEPPDDCVSEEGCSCGVNDLCEGDLICDTDGICKSPESISGDEISGDEEGGVERAGVEISGAEVSGAEVSGAEVSGIDVAGITPSGAETAGVDSAGVDCAGDEGCPCDETSACAEGLICNSEDICEICIGGEGCSCSEERACNEGLYCADDDLCERCGAEGFTCCPLNELDDRVAPPCEEGLICSEEDTCQSCGGVNERCCTDVSGLVCDTDLVCEQELCVTPPPPCGDLGESCCEVGDPCSHQDLRCDVSNSVCISCVGERGCSCDAGVCNSGADRCDQDICISCAGEEGCTCDDDQDCDSPLTCEQAESGLRCLDCRGQQGCSCTEAETCNDELTCIDDSCVSVICGDGELIEGIEECDDGNEIDGDDCDSNCTLTGCGNGVVTDDELNCDCPPNTVNLDLMGENGCECAVIAADDITCDGVDDDCDGAIDEGFDPNLEEFGDCGGYDGVCGEVGVQTRTRLSCVDGQIIETIETQACSRDTDGTVVSTGQYGACGGYRDVCDETGTQSRTNQVCVDGAQVDTNETQACSRDTDGTVVSTGQYGACGGYRDVCDETGTQSRTNQVCADGAQVDANETQACSRDTDGTVVSTGQYGACGGYRDVCDETGTQSRTNQVCADGAQVDANETQACSRDTDGTVVSTGQYGVCGGYSDVCDETGTQSRTNQVCVDGAQVDTNETQACSRDTDGTVVSTGQYGACGGYSDICDETGTQSRTNQVCADGAQVDTSESRGCSRDTDGTVVSTGQYGACGGYRDVCDETGTQSRTNQVCVDGAQVDTNETQACSRDTDGTVVSTGQYGACGGYSDICDETGTQSRTNQVCADGAQVDTSESRGCSRDTDGTVVSTGQYGACGGYRDVCDETGTQSRTNQVCVDGAQVDTNETQACSRDTDGTVVSTGQYGACGGYRDVCDETGTQSRTNQVCVDGAQVDTNETQACSRDTDGTVVSTGQYGACGGYRDVCDETGTQSRTNQVCADGAQVDTNETQACSRDTDGTVVSTGQYGACGGYRDVCDETGTQSRTNQVCADGAQVDANETQACSRDTDGTVVSTGQYGVCGGYSDVCDETGTQSRTNQVCVDGAQVDTNETQACSRDTDGTVVSTGQYGACGGYSDICDETGTQSRTNQVCADGAQVDTSESRGCSRDTDGTVVSTGQYGACGGYRDVCDETGTQSRTNQVCVDGAQVDTNETQACSRDTDGTVVSTGQYGACGGYRDVCDETGTQSRTNQVCVDGAQVDTNETQACSRDTDGTVVSTGQYGACGGYRDVCDETGTQSRTNQVCVDGAQVDTNETQACSRDTDGTVVSTGQYGACGGYRDVCDETGTQSRTNQVCVDGAQVDTNETQACSRDTDGTVVSTGQYGACGGYRDVCDETGTQSRTNQVCVDGAQVDINETQACSRDTDGTVVSTGQYGACGGYRDVCDETGTQSRTNQVCVDGAQVDTNETQACSRDTDGTVVSTGQYGTCGGYSDICDETGTQSRTNQVCVDGAQVDTNETQACSRDTDGTVVSTGQYGACGGYRDVCDETGTQSRTNQVCVDGAQVDTNETQACSRDTDGTVVSTGQYGACGGYRDVCDETGTQSRTNQVCVDGAQVDTNETQACSRDTDGTVVSTGQYGACGGYRDVCDETGTQSRTNQVCADGAQVNTSESRGCSRDTDGTVVSTGQYGACGGYSSTCDETGTQSRTNQVCANGAQVDTNEIRGCSRDTDGTVVSTGQYGACGGYRDVCDETGTQSRTNQVCVDGAQVDINETQACSRDTDGTVVSTGQYGACGGYRDVCDETGTQSRTNQVCVDGAQVNTSESRGCSRDTDGNVVSTGQYGACGGYSSTCDETGTQSRTNQVCANGAQVDTNEIRGCSRDTDGTVVSTGQYGACGGYSSTCDETGTQSRTNQVCADGAQVNTSESRGCSRDTDGTVVSTGQYGACGGYSSTCDETGTQSRTNQVCANGAQVNTSESRGCSRDTDGTVVSTGQYGACGGYSDACDETGTQSRTNQVCANGAQVNSSETQACSRDTSNTIVSVQDGACGGFNDVCDETGSITRTTTYCDGRQSTSTQPCSRQTQGRICFNIFNQRGLCDNGFCSANGPNPF